MKPSFLGLAVAMMIGIGGPAASDGYGTAMMTVTELTKAKVDWQGGAWIELSTEETANCELTFTHKSFNSDGGLTQTIVTVLDFKNVNPRHLATDGKRMVGVWADGLAEIFPREKTAYGETIRDTVNGEWLAARGGTEEAATLVAALKTVTSVCKG